MYSVNDVMSVSGTYRWLRLQGIFDIPALAISAERSDEEGYFGAYKLLGMD